MAERRCHQMAAGSQEQRASLAIRRDASRNGLWLTPIEGRVKLAVRTSRGGREVSVDQAKTILNAVLDSGISLIDIPPDYGASEELIGEFISHRRS